MYEDLSIVLSAIGTGISVIQLAIAFNGDKEQPKKGKIPNITAAQFLLYIAGFIALLPIVVSLFMHNQSGHYGVYKFSANELFRMAWGIFLVVVGIGLNAYKKDG